MALIPLPSLSDLADRLAAAQTEIDALKTQISARVSAEGALAQRVEEAKAEAVAEAVEVAGVEASAAIEEAVAVSEAARPLVDAVKAAAWVVAGEGRAGRVRRLAGQQ